MGLYAEDEPIRRLENPLPQGISQYMDTSRPLQTETTIQEESESILTPSEIDESINELRESLLKVSESGSKLDALDDKKGTSLHV